jgi:hypothetical protein
MQKNFYVIAQYAFADPNRVISEDVTTAQHRRSGTIVWER